MDVHTVVSAQGGCRRRTRMSPPKSCGLGLLSAFAERLFGRRPPRRLSSAASSLADTILSIGRNRLSSRTSDSRRCTSRCRCRRHEACTRQKRCQRAPAARAGPGRSSHFSKALRIGSARFLWWSMHKTLSIAKHTHRLPLRVAGAGAGLRSCGQWPWASSKGPHTLRRRSNAAASGYEMGRSAISTSGRRSKRRSFPSSAPVSASVFPFVGSTSDGRRARLVTCRKSSLGELTARWLNH